MTRSYELARKAARAARAAANEAGAEVCSAEVVANRAEPARAKAIAEAHFERLSEAYLVADAIAAAAELAAYRAQPKPTAEQIAHGKEQMALLAQAAAEVAKRHAREAWSESWRACELMTAAKQDAAEAEAIADEAAVIAEGARATADRLTAAADAAHKAANEADDTAMAAEAFA